jgi:hypothetical protein
MMAAEPAATADCSTGIDRALAIDTRRAHYA